MNFFKASDFDFAAEGKPYSDLAADIANRKLQSELDRYKCGADDILGQVIGDLLNAEQRINRQIGDPMIVQWFHGYRDALLAASERFKACRNTCGARLKATWSDVGL